MGLEIRYITLVGQGLNVKFNNNHQNQRISFKGEQRIDSFEKVDIAKFFDKEQIRYMILSNPEILKILHENKILLTLNLKELVQLRDNHCSDVVENCAKIVENLPQSLKQNVKMKELKEAAFLHDIGKVLIPKSILNKSSALDSNEREIMNLHSELGYQLLKNTGLNAEVLNLVRYHHNISGGKDYVPDINVEILNLADKYSALTESRVYKEKYTPQQALTVLSKEVQQGKVSQIVFNSLVKAVLEQSQNIALNNC